MTFSKGLNLFSIAVGIIAVIGGIILLIEHIEMSKYFWISVGYSAASLISSVINLLQDE